MNELLNQVFNEDCLEGMRKLPNDSIDLVVIDPPYNIKKAEWDTWETVSAYVKFMGEIFKEIERVLKPTGSFYFFHNDFLQIVELQNYLNKETDFVFKSLITINKPKFKVFAWKNRTEKASDRKWFPNVEYCLFYTFQNEDFETGRKVIDHDPNRFKEFRNYAKEVHTTIGRPSNRELQKEFEGRMLEHFFYYNSTQFSLPTKANYERLVERYNLQELDFYRTYEDLKAGYEAERLEYEAERLKWIELNRYTFNKGDNLSTVWDWGSELNSGKLHPTQKPAEIIEKIISHSSNLGDIVLDCFMGSGTTAIACLNTGRNYIGFELDETYHALLTERINAHITQNTEVDAIEPI